MTIAVIVVVTMGDLTHIHIRILPTNIREVLVKKSGLHVSIQQAVVFCTLLGLLGTEVGEKCDLLFVSPGVVAPVLTEGDGVLDPGLVLS